MIEKPDIAVILEHYGAAMVPLRARWAPMKCPFHEDRSASASVNRDAGKFKCFACDLNGDGFDLIEWKEGFNDFARTVSFAEELSGRSLRDVLQGSNGRTRRNRLSEEPGTVRGQRSILQARRRRKPLAGA